MSRRPDEPKLTRLYVSRVLVGLPIVLVFVVIYLRAIPNLTKYGEIGFFRYLVLVVVALFGAAALFGVLQSSATIVYTDPHWRIRVGGPAAVSALIVAGGLWFAPAAPQTFDLTVRATSEDGSFITSGLIVIDLATDRRTETLNSIGEVNFKQIPWHFRGTNVKLVPRVDGYYQTPQIFTLSGDPIYLKLVKLPPTVTMFRGTLTGDFRKLRETKIIVEGQKTEGSPDQYGRFEVPVQGEPGQSIRVKLFVGGKLTYDDFQTLPGPVTIPLLAGRKAVQ